MVVLFERIPGVRKVEGREFRYIEHSDAQSFAQLFPTISSFGCGGLPKFGGILNENTVIMLPTGERLFGVSCKGDSAGWSAKVEACCHALGSRWATIDGNTLVLSDGKHFNLADCNIKAD